jgi:acyl carrier protein
MTQPEMLSLFASLLEVKEVKLDDEMGVVRGWDSLNHLNLILGLEERFGISIPPDRVGELTSVKAILGFCSEQGVAVEELQH